MGKDCQRKKRPQILAAPKMSEWNLFTELRRRNVFRAAAFYAAGAWLLVQVATQVFPFFQIANWLVHWVIFATSEIHDKIDLGQRSFSPTPWSGLDKLLRPGEAKG